MGLALTAAATVRAVQPGDLFYVQKGPVALKPQLHASQTFNDNVTYREKGGSADFITTVSPGLGLQVGRLDYNYLEAQYFYDRVQYWDHSTLTANQHRVAIDSRVGISRFTLRGRDRIEFLSSPVAGGISVGGDRVDRVVYLDEYRLSYELSPKTSFYGEITHDSVDYESGIALYDARTLIGTLGFSYLAFSRTSFFGEAYYGTTENDPNTARLGPYPAASFVGGFVGARGRFTEKIEGMVKAGYETRSYDGRDQDSSTPVVEASVTARLREKTGLVLNFSRRQYESAQFANSSYTRTGVVVDLQQEVGTTGRMKAVLRGEYVITDYESTRAFARQRQDTIAGAGLNLTYDIKLWFRIFGGYNFEYFESTEPILADYKVNRVRLGMELGY